MSQQLVAVADAEDGHTELEDGGINVVRVVGVDRSRSAGQDDGGWLMPGGFGRRGVARHNLGEDVGLPHPAGDELCVLCPEVVDEDLVEVLHLARHQAMPICWAFWSALPSVCRAGAIITSAF